jgi:hypothetical protein
MITPETLAERICRALEVAPRDGAETIREILRTATAELQSAAVAATKVACLEIAEDEAERCRAGGASAPQQTALVIAARIRRRHIEVGP